MIDTSQLTQHWVEVREDSTHSTLVFRPLSYKLPPARGRRHLNLLSDGSVVVSHPGEDDRSVHQVGSWSLSSDELAIDAPQWKGTYYIDELVENKLLLRQQ